MYIIGYGLSPPKTTSRPRVNALLREMMQERLNKEGRMRAAVNQMLQVAEHGPWSNVDPTSFRREELH